MKPTMTDAQRDEMLEKSPERRVTRDGIEAKIIDETYDHPTGTLTRCVLTLQNGFTVTGESACASPANFNAELGQKVARDQAFNKIWALEGYLLREQLHNEILNAPAAEGGQSVGASASEGSALGNDQKAA